MQGACKKKPFFRFSLGKKRCDIFVFDIFFDRFSFEAGRQYALDVFQSHGEPAL